MSQNETARLVERPEISESPGAAMSKLSELAQQAYEKKDKKECLDLTRAMLLIDPHNADALWIRSSIQSDIQRDLDSAREFLRQAQSRDSADKPATAGDSRTPSSETVEPLPSRTAIISADVPFGDTALMFAPCARRYSTTESLPPVAA